MIPKWSGSPGVMWLINRRPIAVGFTRWNHLNGKHWLYRDHKDRGTIGYRLQVVLPMRRFRVGRHCLYLWVLVARHG